MNRWKNKRLDTLPMMRPTIKQTPENKPRCLLSVTSSVGNTAPNGSAWMIDATDKRRCGITGDSTRRRWTESVLAGDDDGIGVTWLF